MLKKLHTAYMGELFGIVFFNVFKERSADPLEQEKWHRLIEVEQRTAALLKAYLEPLGMRCPPSDKEVTKQGLDQAQAWLDLSWGPLMETLAPWIREYAEMYRRSAESATEHRDIWNMVADHEEALLSFVEGERDGVSDGLEMVRGFLMRYA